MKKHNKRKRACARKKAAIARTAQKNNVCTATTPSKIGASKSIPQKIFSKAQNGMTALRSPLMGFFSKLVLILAIIALSVTNGIHFLQQKWNDFYYLHIYHKLKPFGIRFEAIRHSRTQLITLITTFVLLIPMISTMRLGVSVIVDGKVLGYVQNETEIRAACTELETNASKLTGKPYSLDANISYSVGFVPQNHFINENTLSSKLVNSIDSLTSLAVIKIDGNIIGACKNATEAQNILNRIKNQYVPKQDSSSEPLPNSTTLSSTETTLENQPIPLNHTVNAEADINPSPETQVDFLENLSIETVQAPIELLKTEDALFQKLSTETIPAKTYCASESDTLSSIALAHNMSTNALLDLNPNIIPERLRPGTQVVLAAEKPILSVEVKTVVNYTEAIPYTTIKQNNASIAQNSTEIIQSGMDGKASVRAEITTVNGVEQDRTILSRTVLSNATNEIVAVGTKKTGIGSGTLVSPIAGGTITSGYKFRWGRMHKGVDYGCSSGTIVRAADSGKVILSQYSENGYGYYVIIDHRNGMKTLYAHNSKLLVNVGDIVEKGQTIAYSGNTGNTTGPHCHFEVLLDNENVNPENYV